MENKMLSVDVTTRGEDGNVIVALSMVNCPPAQLNAILSLCKKDYVVTINFVEVDLSNINGMRS